MLDGHRIAADLLAKEVHSTFDAARLSDLDFDVIPEEDDRSFTPADLGIWIDPIGQFSLWGQPIPPGPPS